MNKSKEPEYLKEYRKIKRRCLFQKIFSGYLLSSFFILQYSVPIFLVVLGSVATSKEQLIELVSEQTEPSSNSHTNPEYSQSEIIVSRIIYLVGLISILLGVINNIIRPAESYDITAKYNNKFEHFDINFDLEFMMISKEHNDCNKFVTDQDSVKILLEFLIKKNNELHQLIEEFNQARSISPHGTSHQSSNIKEINHTEDNKK